MRRYLYFRSARHNYTAAAYLNLYYRENNPEYLERLFERKTLLTPQKMTILARDFLKLFIGVYLKMIEAREAPVSQDLGHGYRGHGRMS